MLFIITFPGLQMMNFIMCREVLKLREEVSELRKQRRFDPDGPSAPSPLPQPLNSVEE